MNEPITLREAATQLRTRMWRTAGARFNCYRRMKRRNTLSAFTIATLSVYLIGITVCQKVYDIGHTNPMFDNHLSSVSIIGAIFIVVLSLIEWAGDYSSRGDKLFENATEIKILQSKIERALIEGTSEDKLRQEFEQVNTGYESLTNKNSFNHDPIDDFLFRAQNLTESNFSFQMSCFTRLWARIWWFFIAYWIYITALIAPVLAIVFLYCKTTSLS